MEKKKWLQILELIEKCEDEYGSITKTPSVDPNFMEAQRMLSSGETSGLKTAIDPDQEDAIIDMIEEGRTILYVANKFDLKQRVVEDLVNRLGLTVKDHFVWYLTNSDPDIPTYFFTSCNKALPLIFNKYFKNNKSRNRFLKENNYRLRKKYTIWKYIPDGSYYMTKGNTQFHLKTGYDSYIETD